MTDMMTAVRLHSPEDLRLDEVPIPDAGPGEVLIRVHRCGICGTDLHITKGNFPAPNLPLVLGHEFSGTVTSIGDGVSDVGVGDRVVVDINISCGHCYFCRRGQKLFCPRVTQLGVHRAGGLAEYVAAPAANVYVLPNSVSLDTAAYVEPLACAIHGQDRIGIRSGDRVLIIGGGPMGLAHIALSRLSGASKVIVSEPDERRRELSRRLGADELVNPFDTPVPTYESSVAAVRRGGKVLAYGAAPMDKSMSLRPFDIYAKELTIVGSYAGTYDTWPRAIELLAGGRFDPSRIVDSVRPLDEAVDAIRGLERDKSTVKVHIQA
jgi:threonine dehydrogenase-like Zn-dependent dehydrogenase